MDHKEMICKLKEMETTLEAMLESFDTIGKSLQKEFPNQTMYDIPLLPGIDEIEPETENYYKKLMGETLYEILCLQDRIDSLSGKLYDLAEKHDSLFCKLSQEIELDKLLNR